ncbi:MULTISPECIES: hypothetical protein [Amycolatopsis]|uniref:Lipoprotein n=1 Tax=Amycolatopsis albidoflavus TaxID=102226 RepID=A0ABW5HYG8_9PSEU
MIRPVSNRLFLRYGTVAAAAALVCTSCSGSDGNAAQPPAAASPAASSSAAPSADPLDPAAIKAAMKKATAVHVKGTNNNRGEMKIDLQMNKDSVSGSIEQDGVEVPVLRVGDKVWMKFTKSLTKKAKLPAAAAAMVNDKWVSLDSQLGQGLGETFKLVTDYDVFVSGMASEADQPDFSTGQPAEVAGTLALRYQNDSTTIFIEAVSPHRLLRMESPKDGTMEFSGWDQPVPAQAPPAAEIYSGPGS